MAKGTIEVDKLRCKGCSICVEVCPKKVIALSKETNAKGYYYAQQVDPENCTGCTLCAQMCPDVAIRVWRTVEK